MAAAWRSILLTPNVLGRDGVSALSREIARALPAPALVVSLHDPPASADRSPVGVEIRGVRSSRMAFVAAVLGLLRRTSPSTAVVCSHLHLSPAAKWLSWRGGRPTIVLCGIEAWVPARMLERWALSTSEVTAISQHTIDRFRSANPELRALEVSLCHPGVPSTRAVDAAVQTIPSHAALIVARMSASERYKGHDALLDVWPALLQRHPEAVLVVAGEGDDRARLQGRARDLGVEQAVLFTGSVSDEVLASMYDQCRFFVMPSRDEGFGLVFLEAMRAGKPCIGGTGAAAEIVEHGVTGFIVDPDQPRELEAALTRLYDEPAACVQMGAAGRARFLSCFTDAHFRARFARVVARTGPATLAASVS